MIKIILFHYPAHYLSGLQPSTVSVPKAEQFTPRMDLPAKFDWYVYEYTAFT